MDPIAKFDLPTRNTVNQIRFDFKSGKKHRLKVIEICKQLIEQDIDFVTRGRLNSKNLKEQLVCDIADITWGTIYEVQDSESDKSIIRKRQIWENNGFIFEVVKI